MFLLGQAPFFVQKILPDAKYIFIRNTKIMISSWGQVNRLYTAFPRKLITPKMPY